MFAKTVFKRYGSFKVFGSLAVAVALLCLLVPVSVRADENDPAPKKIGIYVTPKFTANCMSWKLHDATDSVGSKYNTNPAALTGGGAGSFSFGSTEHDTLWGGALAIGYDFYPRFDLPLRMELEYALYSNASGSGNYDMPPSLANQIVNIKNSTGRSAQVDLDLKLRNIQTLMFNAYWDFHNSTNFTPYIGAGVGLAFLQTDGSVTTTMYRGAGTTKVYKQDIGTRNNTNFAWQVGAGCSYAFTDTISLDLGYRFMGLGKAESNDIHLTDINPQQRTIVIESKGKAEARDIYMHQIALGLRFTF